ncbi:MAG: flagellar filament capping protein FliD [Bacillota bacterium]
MSNRISLNVTGLDTESIVSSLMALERQPLVRLQNEQTLLLQKKTAWNNVKSQIDKVSEKIAALAKAASFEGKTAKVSSSSVLTATTTAAAVSGTYEVHVHTLAAAQVVQSSGFPSMTEPFATPVAGTVTLNGQSITISETDTLESITAKINATANVGARAAILQTSPGVYRMILTSEKTGAAGAMEFGGDLAVWRNLGVLDAGDAVNEVTAATDASFTVNGISFTRSSNSVSDAIPGVTFSLLQAGDGAKTSITVESDDEAIIASVKEFITEYNNMIDTVGKYNTYDSSTRKAGLLFGDPLVTGLLSQMRAAIFSTVAGAPAEYATLSLVGITTGTGAAYSKDGKLTLDETKLRDALKANREGVAVLFGARPANAARGATITATSSLDPGLYPASSVNDGVTGSALWGAGGGWSDGTPGDFTDDRIVVDFGQARTIDKLTVHTVNSAAFPAAGFGIRDFSFEYWDGSAWVALGDPVTGNTGAYKSVSFSPVTTTKIRLNVTASNDGQYSRVTEIEAFQENEGAFAKLADIANRYTAADGFVTHRTEALENQDKALQRRMEDMQRRLDNKEASLRRQYTALEVTLGKLNSQSAWLTQQINSLALQ